MKKKIFCVALGALLFALCGSAEAQQPRKLHRIGILDRTAASNSRVLWDAFRQEMRKLGWIEGNNVEYRFTEEKNENAPELARDLVRSKVDLIVVTGIPLALAAKKATSTIPIVMTNVSDPVGAGLVASLARPEGNVTGLASLSTELNTKRLEVLKDAVPRLSRVGVLRLSGDNKGQEIQMKELKPAALALKLNLEEIETQADAKGLDSAFHTANNKQVGAILPANTSCRLFTFRRSLSMRAVSCPTARTTTTSFDARLVTSTRSLKAPNLLICRCSRQQNLNSSLILRRHNKSV